jgi:lysylphosphatidylglycerol synthetase-like protein (DUF2156 family)
MMGEQVRWQGVGRWFSYAVAALLVIIAIPSFATNDAAAGWNIFLGLLLFGGVASGSRRAPLLLLVLIGLMLLRVLVALAAERNVVEAVGDGILLILLFFAWQDLRRQALLVVEHEPEQTC